MKPKPSVRVRSFAGSRDLVSVSLLSGSVATFRRVVSVFGKRGILGSAAGTAVAAAGTAAAGSSVSSKTYFVPMEAALACLKDLGRAGFTILASGVDQLLVKDAQFRCELGGLYPHQRSAAEFLRVRRRAVLADEMGVGKTASALASIDASKGVLVVCPAVMVGEWLKEVQRWRPDLRPILWKRPYSIFPEAGEVVVVAYSRLPEECVEERSRCPWCEKLAVVEFKDARNFGVHDWAHHCMQGLGGCGRSFDQKEDVWTEAVWSGPAPQGPVQLIVDEAHYCKTRSSKRTTIVRALAARCSRVSLLTGTPLLNEPMDLWTLCSLFEGQGKFDTAAHATFGSMARFGEMFRGKKNRWGGWEWRDEDPDPRARDLLGTLMLRRTRAEVLSDLPSKRRRFIDVEIGRDLGRAAAFGELGRMSDEEVLAACGQASWLSKARAELAMAKLPALLDLVEEHEAERQPCVVFSYHRAPIEELGRRKGWAAIMGATDALERTRLVAEFQAGKLKGIAGTIGAMGVGVTLTASASALFLDRDYVPANNLQGEDRLSRIGQKRGVVVTVLRAQHPVDQRVEAILERKERMLVGAGLGPGEPAAEESAS